MAAPELSVEQWIVLGENDQWQFLVGRLACKSGDRWIGAACSHGLIADGSRFLDVLPEISVDLELGIPDRDEAIRKTTAVVQVPERGFGGVDRWFIEPRRRGSPEAYRCHNCGRVGCDFRECLEDEYWE